MNEISIRVATDHDLPAILRLYQEAQIDGECGFLVEEAVAHFAVLKRYPYFRVFVAVLGDAIVGTYELAILDNMAKRGRRSGVVEDVAVSPDHQAHGVGRTMMHHALDQCRLEGCYKMTLSSNVRREGAHRFYETLGFTRHGYSFQVELPGK